MTIASTPRPSARRARLDPLLKTADDALLDQSFGPEQLAQLKALQTDKAPDWASSSEHAIAIDPNRWSSSCPELTTMVSADGTLSRHSITELAADCSRSGIWEPLMRVSYAWGSGNTGYGPFRLDSILEARETLEETLQRAVRHLRENGAVSAYAFLRGQQSEAYRTQDGTQRVPGWGPAFFTKFLHFAGTAVCHPGPAPLILDARVARTLRALAAEANQGLDLPSDVSPDELARWGWGAGGWWAGRYLTYLEFVERRVPEAEQGIESWPKDDPAMIEFALWHGQPLALPHPAS